VDPFDEIRRVWKKLFFGPFFWDDEWFPRPAVTEEGFVREPLVDVREEKDRIIVTAEVPGVEKKDIKLRIKDDEFGNQRLVISARREEQKRKKGSFSASSMVFVKEVSLPARVKKQGAEATYKNGILEVKLVRVEPKEKERVDIPIK